MKSIKIHFDVYAGVFIGFLGIFFLFEANNLNKSAARFPKLVLITLIVFALIILVRGIKLSLEAQKKNTEVETIKFSEIRIPLLVFLFTVIYSVGVNLLGFFISTAIFIPALMLFYKQKSPRLIIGSTLGMILFVYLLFVMQLKLTLP